MKRIATPMIGGVITSTVLNLLIYPVIYFMWRRRNLPKPIVPVGDPAVAENGRTGCGAALI
jgi:Cu(I)/Ag(I) efflux system membrane protein CusA/SilA